MDEYSFLQGIGDAGLTLLEHGEENNLEEVYNSLWPSFLKGTVSSILRKGVLDILRGVVDVLAPPGVSRSDYISVLKLGCKVPRYLDRFKGIDLVNEGVGLAKRLQETYDNGSIDTESYVQGIDCFYNVFDKLTNNGLVKVGSGLKKVREMLSILNSGKPKIEALKTSPSYKVAKTN